MGLKPQARPQMRNIDFQFEVATNSIFRVSAAVVTNKLKSDLLGVQQYIDHPVQQSEALINRNLTWMYTQHLERRFMFMPSISDVAVAK